MVGVDQLETAKVIDRTSTPAALLRNEADALGGAACALVQRARACHDDTRASRSALRASIHSSSSEISQPTERRPRCIGLGARPALVVPRRGGDTRQLITLR